MILGLCTASYLKSLRFMFFLILLASLASWKLLMAGVTDRSGKSTGGGSINKELH